MKTLTPEEVKQAVQDWLTSGGEKGADWLPSLVESLEKAREEVEALHRERKGEVWYWQGDGYDFPESLTCPVLIGAEALRQILRK